ncbi:MAG: prepilin-type N-terminal cleavage/methylation domain-containing protein [Saccharofermentans sp.]|nr:prepilin-type N-terminal cleavage/methylation domain-containing protein [Saccharofermentans sp.]
MKRLSKNSKKGLTLVEIMFVIAIIVILATVLIFGIGRYLKLLDLDSYKIEQAST